MKRVVSLILCLMLVLGMATTAFAAEVENRTTHDYKAYQIFTGTQAEGTGELGQINWGTGIDHVALLADLKTTYDTFDTCVTAADVAAVLTSVAIAEDFADVAIQHISGTGKEIAAGQTDIELEAGYYLLVDQTVPGESDAKNPALLQVTNVGKVTIAKKYDVPTHDKYIESTDDAGQPVHRDNEDYSIGDMVDFRLKATLPNNLEDFEQYKLVLHDALSEGLSFDSTTVSVTVGGKTAKPGIDYTVTEGDCDKTSKNCTFHITFNNILTAEGCANGAVVIASYKAQLNDNARIDTGNPNEYMLEYSNDPDWDPNDPTPPTIPTGVTPWNEVKVWTTEVTLNKVDGATDQPLTGATFKITGDKINRVKTTGQEFVLTTADGESVDSKTYWKLNDGKYTDVDPTGDGIDASVYEDVSVTYKLVNYVKYITETESVAVERAVGEDGVLKLSGLGEGTYVIEETVVPAGYNKIENINLTITFNEQSSTFTYYWSGGATGSLNTISVENNKGSVLPETGGMGTTLFYTVGGLMVAAAAILLITKKRMSAEV